MKKERLRRIFSLEAYQSVAGLCSAPNIAGDGIAQENLPFEEINQLANPEMLQNYIESRCGRWWPISAHIASCSGTSPTTVKDEIPY
jgi:hypothetical protein